MTKPTHPPGIARFDREYGEWANPEQERQLFKRGEHSSIARYDRESGRRPGKPPRDYAALLRPLFYAAILYVLWMGVHEAVHYASCEYIGNSARLMSLFPSPRIACDSERMQMPTEAFIYFISPYMVAILVLIAFSGTQDRFIRLLSYAAFFDLQYNLFATTLMGGVFHDGKNDLMRLLEHTGAIGENAPTMVQMQLYSIYFLIILATASFFFLYGGDLVHGRRRRFYLPAFVFYAVFYGISAATLYPAYWSADGMDQALSIARTFFTTSSGSASFALLS